MDRADIVVVQGRGGFRFVDEAPVLFVVRAKMGCEEFQNDKAVEAQVPGLVDNAHASTSEVLEDHVVGDRLADEGNHRGFSSTGKDGRFRIVGAVMYFSMAELANDA
jgi:hypothetical protein